MKFNQKFSSLISIMKRTILNNIIYTARRKQW